MMPKPKHRQKRYKFAFIITIVSTIILFGVALVKNIPPVKITPTLHSTLGRGWFTSTDWQYVGDTVAIGSSTGIWLYHADDLSEPFHHLPSDSAPISSIAFSADEHYLVAGSWDTRAYIWELSDLSQPMHILRGHRGFVNDVAIDPDSHWVATAGTDKVVRIWDFETGEEIAVFEGHEHSVTTIAVSADGRILASGSRDGTVRVYDTETHKQIRQFTPVEEIRDLMFPDESTRLTVLTERGIEYTYDLTTGNTVMIILSNNKTLNPHITALNLSAMGFYPPVNTLEIAPDGKTIAVGTGNLFTPDYRAMVWDLTSKTVIASLDTFDEAIITLAYHPEKSLLAIGNTAGNLYVWDYQTHSTDTWQAHDGELLSMTFTDNNTLVTGGDDAMVRVWDITTGKLITEFESPNGAVHNIAFGENINFAQDRLDDSLTSYALSDEEQNLNLLCSHGDTIGAVVLNHDASLRATATFNNTILLTDVASGEILYTLEGHLNLIEDLTFSPDGRWLASASWDQTVRIWELSTGKNILTLQGHTRPVTSVRFSPDNKKIISGSDDGTIRVWELS